MRERPEGLNLTRLPKEELEIESDWLLHDCADSAPILTHYVSSPVYFIYEVRLIAPVSPALNVPMVK